IAHWSADGNAIIVRTEVDLRVYWGENPSGKGGKAGLFLLNSNYPALPVVKPNPFGGAGRI
ncbi:MAG: hypothetical protein KDA84_10870, partial [Planctomycetaceae bacterium]|nr:hypothetical protein [Planctomycetaceae bacterium]